ncbi:Plasmid stabilization system protein ParE [Rhizobiales bacterium GAS191]|jgi:toxin ParE1/3/4|nr:Plasmid stabilization system protein ParE [Rhizobiales bacterium GAS113]SED54039.1 Plasmid stabilization system protein ParE [Rhizobiales bacterium GAS188]SEE89932.1 Plasmid stabilization system protein ParE [Rhizobiales bacterium GAS191]
MVQVTVAATADADTASILSDLETKAGKATAARYNSLFESVYDRLADYPDSGPLRQALGPNIRIGIVPPYIIIYRHVAADDTVTILRIVHGRREIASRLLGDRS